MCRYSSVTIPTELAKRALDPEVYKLALACVDELTELYWQKYLEARYGNRRQNR